MIGDFLSKIFSIRDIDSHYILILFGIQIRIKHSHTEPEIILKESGITEKSREIPVIVSLTSFPGRIHTVSKCIKTLLTQTMKPDKIILWLSEEEFPQREKNLPENLLDLKDYGLTIDWNKENWRSFTKLLPALRKYPDSVIITVDDDIYYPKDTVETLYNSYIKNPQNIQAHRCARIKLKSGKIQNVPSINLYTKNFSKPSFLNRLSGYSGVLYPPQSLNKEVFNQDFFLNNIKTHDDIWFWAAAVLNRTKTQVVKGYRDSLYNVEDSQNFALCKVNKISTTSKAYEILLEFYPQILNILKEEQE